MIYHDIWYSNTWYHHLRFLKWIGTSLALFSLLLSPTCFLLPARGRVSLSEILLYLPLCLHTSTHTRLISFKETVPLKAAAPRELLCVCLRVCVWRRERDERPLLAARGVNAVDYNEAPLPDLLLPLLPSAPPHAHLISLPPPFLTRSPPFSFLPLSVREGIQCADGASFNKVKCSASVRKISQESRARSFRGDLLRFNLNEGILSSVLSWSQSLLCRVVSSHQGTSDSLLSLSLSLSLSFHSTFCWSLPLVQWLRDACSEWLWTPAVQEVKGEVKHFF